MNSVDAESRAGFLGDMERLIALQYHGAVERNLLYDRLSAPVTEAVQRGREGASIT